MLQLLGIRKPSVVVGDDDQSDLQVPGGEYGEQTLDFANDYLRCPANGCAKTKLYGRTSTYLIFQSR